MCDNCNQVQSKAYTAGAQIAGQAVNSDMAKRLYERKYRLERDLDSVNEAIKLVETDEGMRKLTFVIEQSNKL